MEVGLCPAVDQVVVAQDVVVACNVITALVSIVTHDVYLQESWLCRGTQF